MAARTRTLTNLIADVRSRADQQDQSNTPFCTDAEITEWLNQAWAELYEDLCASGEKYYLKSATVSTSSGTDTYAFTTFAAVGGGDATDLYELLGVDVGSGGSWYDAHRYQFERRNDYSGAAGSWAWPQPVQYDLRGNAIQFLQSPGGTFTIRIWYYPVPVRMSAGSDVIDGVAGWEIFVVDWAAKKCAEKQDEGELAAALGQAIAATKMRVLSRAGRRIVGEAPKMRVVRGRSSGISYGANARRWWGW